MSISFTCQLLAALSLVAAFSHASVAAPGTPQIPIVHKQLSPKCASGALGPVSDQPSNKLIPHQYMLLLVFQKGRGSKYFGDATVNQYGCIPDVESQTDTATNKTVLKETGTLMTVANCPNDCVFPRTTVTAMEGGADPLDSNPWGILSATDTTRAGGASNSKIEIWEIAAIDACHARRVYAYLTKRGTDRVLAKALARGDMLGEILVGYRDPNYKEGPSTVCN
ncbi:MULTISPECIES: hypothetical protein [unclassified Janthinobacterium]|nr:hypothetical protein [Janthinobacterium sp. CG_23.4]MDH6155926.1 hypothetical protein [Janthinobacterium sp. CG_23.4]